MAAATKWRNWRFGALLLSAIVSVVNGYEEAYRISQLSPKSGIHRGDLHGVLQSSREELVLSVQPSALPHHRLPPERGYYTVERSAYPGDALPDTDYEQEQLEYADESEGAHYVLVRSAEPRDRARASRSIRTQAHNDLDDLLHHKRKYYDIHPTKTRDPEGASGDRLEFTWAGEAARAPRGRALSAGARLTPSAVRPTYATRPADAPRQNTEIQNIITGIVKLLNGNVNVQANTQLLRPGRPLATRINNRGPPRISDVPIDLEKPMPAHSFLPTKTPPPYPFDRPPLRVPLPEQMVPPPGLPSRPLHRPLPPWQRPRPPRPDRRPSPAIPMYKPQIIPYDIPEVPDEERPGDVTPNENETLHSENVIHHDHDELSFQPEPETATDAPPDEPSTEPALADTHNTTETTTTTTSSTTTETPKTEKSVKVEKKKETPVLEKDKPKDKMEKTTLPPKSDPTTNKPTPVETTTEPAKEDNTKVNKTASAVAEVAAPQLKDETSQNETASGSAGDQSPAAPSQPEPAVLQPSHPSVVEEAPSPAHTTPLPVASAPTAATTTNYGVVVPIADSQPLPVESVGGGGIPYQPYRPRPGIVLDDPEFKPHAHGGGGPARPPLAPARAPLAPARPPHNYGEIFDVTVSAIQGPGGSPHTVDIEKVRVPFGSGSEGVIVTGVAGGEEGFVSIDGKRTYLNLFEQATPAAAPPQPAHIAPTAAHTHRHASPATAAPRLPPAPSPPQGAGLPPYRRPQPTVRIDTCIVGDDSTCDRAQHERCRTEAGISSCLCRSGYARRRRAPCRRVVALQLSLRVDRLYDRKVAWDATLADKDSDPYHQLSFEAVRAMESAFSMTPFSDDFVSSSVSGLARGEDQRAVYVNATVLMQETAETLSPSVGVEIQKQLLGVLRRRSNNVGSSALYVDSPHGAVLPLHDVDECASAELNDCHPQATCTNVWGGFRCACPEGTLDAEGGGEAGRACRSCPDSTCSGRGACRYRDGQPTCQCSAGYYGARCDVDGSVVGAALGASLAAAAVIALTLAALLSWSRRWSRAGGGAGSPVFKYAGAQVKSPPVGHPPYQVSLEERMRWAQIAEALVASHYQDFIRLANDASPGEQQGLATRPSSAMFGAYPAALPPVPMPRMGTLHGTLNTSSRGALPSHHTIYGYGGGGGGGVVQGASESTSSEASSHAHELLVPRPRSPARSMQNQTGIYYDVEYENAEPLYGTAGPPAAKGIPLSTYTLSRGPPFYR